MRSTYQIVIGRSLTVNGPYLNKEGKSWVDNNYTVFLAGNSTAPGKGHNGFLTDGDTPLSFSKSQILPQLKTPISIKPNSGFVIVFTDKWN